MAGGAGARKIAIRAEPLVVDETVAAVAGPNRGGVVTFTGVVRREGHHLPDVIRLEYEAYVEMAEQVLADIAEEIEREWAGTEIAIHHRIGALGVGEIAVAITAASAHRAPAFEACRAAIDRLKERAPDLEEGDRRQRRSLARPRRLSPSRRPVRNRSGACRQRAHADRGEAIGGAGRHHRRGSRAAGGAGAGGAGGADRRRPVLVTGESGTGKELVARALHELGPEPARARSSPSTAARCRASWPRASCSATSAARSRAPAARRAGWFEEASGGTLVLDEIGELPLDLQPKLLRVLETGRLRRVGGAGEVAVRVRVVAMTLRDLAGRRQPAPLPRATSTTGWRASACALPPLRERRGDIPLLARALPARDRRARWGPRSWTPSALAALRPRRWPGNVRELRNAIRRAAILTRRARRRPHRRRGAGAAAAAAPFRLAEERAPAAAPARARAPATPPLPDDAIQHRRPHVRRDRARDLRRGRCAATTAAGGAPRARSRIARSTFCDKVKRFGLG